MRVKVDNKIYDSKDGPIMVILTDKDKENIANMNKDCTKYCMHQDSMDEEEAYKWMEETENIEEKPRKGSLALCGLKCLGLITQDEPKEITYQDGNKGTAYVGIHLTDKITDIGNSWSSRNPVVVGHVDDLSDKI